MALDACFGGEGDDGELAIGAQRDAIQEPVLARSVMSWLNAAGRPIRPVLAGNCSLQHAGLSRAAHPHLTGGHPRPPSVPCRQEPRRADRSWWGVTLPGQEAN
jgi:hypothetical protein